MTTLCDTCRAPGACCSRFQLTFEVADGDGWQQEATEKLAGHGLTFMHAVSRSFTYPGRLLFDCDRRGADGRCTDYENRPQLCKDYEPGQDGLCAEHVAKFCGIPVITIYTDHAN